MGRKESKVSSWVPSHLLTLNVQGFCGSYPCFPRTVLHLERARDEGSTAPDLQKRRLPCQGQQTL